MNPYAIVGGLLLVIAAYFAGEHRGAKLEEAKWTKIELQHAAEYTASLKTEIAKRRTDQLANEASARKASDIYAQALTTVETTYAAKLADVKRAGGLRIPAPASCRPAATGPKAPGASGPDESAPATIALPAETQRQLFHLSEEADNLSEQLRALQGWVRDNGFYGPPPEASLTERAQWADDVAAILPIR